MMPLSLSSLVSASLSARLLPVAAALLLAAGSAAAQGPMIAGPGYPVGVPGDPFVNGAGGAYAVPISGPVAVAQGFGPEGQYAASPVSYPATSYPATSYPMTAQGYPMTAQGYPMTAQGGPVYMAPQVIGGPSAAGADCPCNRGGATNTAGAMYGPAVGGPVMGGPAMGTPSYGVPSYGEPMTSGSAYGDPGMTAGQPLFTEPGSCGTGMCDAPCGGPVCGGSPCGDSQCDGRHCGDCLCDAMTSLTCDPAPGAACDPCGKGGLYHGIGGAQRHGWAFGYSWVFLKPTLGNGTALATTTFAPGVSRTVNRATDYNFQTGSRVFVEYVLPTDMGFRATYFGLDSDSNGINANTNGSVFVPTGGLFAAGPGTTGSAVSGINLNALDIDLTNRTRAGQWLFNTGGGVRLANFTNNFNAVVNSPGNNQRVDARYRFHGVGPTVYGELRRPVAQTNFALIALARGSILYGNTSNDSFAAFANPAVATPNQVVTSNGHDVVGIGEFQLGGEWSAWISRRTVLFASVAGEAQYWTGVGGVLDNNADLGLFGFNTTVGLEF